MDQLNVFAALATGVAVGLGIAKCGPTAPTAGDETVSGRGKSDKLLPKTLNDALEGRIEDAQAQLKALTRDAGDADEAPSPMPAAYNVGLDVRRELTPSEQEAFNRDGFVVCKGWFTPDEVDILHKAIKADNTVDEQKIAIKDAEGRDTKLTLWWYLGDDTYGQVGRSASLVNAVSTLMDGSEPYHSHTKILLKEPRSGGAWEWHQDFGYWYNQGLQHPDKIVNAIIALDPNTAENGCMRLMRRSHTLGRIDHGTFGGQAGADPTRVVAAMSLPGYEVVKLPLMPGDVAFMHSNTLHASSPNLSDNWRRNIIVAYNSRHNEPLPGAPEGQPQYNQIKVVPDSNIVRVGVKRIDPSQNKMLAM